MGYFKVFNIGKDTWQIKEILGVSFFLFEGDDKALLLDTGNGYRDIRKTLAKLTKKPLTVVNSHGHSDHAGGNRQFPRVYIHPADRHMLDPAWQKSQRDLLAGYVKAHYPILSPALFFLERSKYETVETTVMPLNHGDTFDLGGRRLEAIHFPGHSPGSVAFTDRQTKTLYACDAVNHGLFLFFEGSPTLAEYAERLRGLAKLTGCDEIRISHYEKPLPFSFIQYYIDFLARATLEKSTLTDIPNHGRDVYKYTEDGSRFGLPEIAVHFLKESIA
jgi:glyoxylase-like metal-dependent hydrolase (beta-lactamase superfamily II)